MRVLDLFSAAAGGWSLGLHRAGFQTVAACEFVDWRRALYSMNNPGVVLYDDVRTLTADRIISDFGYFPDTVVGSPPCQDISSANTKGKGVEGERSGLFFEAVRIIGEGRPRWFALENSSNLRTRGADAVLAALEALGYTCWPVVVRAGHGRGGAGIGANHERPRSWLIGCDVEQLTNADGYSIRLAELPKRSVAEETIARHVACHPYGGGRPEEWSRRRCGQYLSDANDPDRQGSGAACNASEDGCGSGWARGCALPTQRLPEQACRNASDAGQERREVGTVVGSVRAPAISETGCDDGQSHDGCRSDADAASIGYEGGRPWRHRQNGYGKAPIATSSPANAAEEGHDGRPPLRPGRETRDQYARDHVSEGVGFVGGASTGNATHADETGQKAGLLESSLRPTEEPDDGRGTRRCDDGSSVIEMGGGEGFGDVVTEPWADWNGGLAHHLRLDDGLSAWVAQSRIAVGGPRGTSAASLIVEAFGDAVLPQIPEAIGRAILRTEAALSHIYCRRSA